MTPEMAAHKARLDAWNARTTEEQMAYLKEQDRATSAPTLLDKAASLAKAVVKQAVAGNPKASPEVQAERRRICFECPMLDQVRDQCSKCGCSMMELKRSWATSRCPDDPPRWAEEPAT